MGKTVNYQCNLGISKVIETLDEDENIVDIVVVTLSARDLGDHACATPRAGAVDDCSQDSVEMMSLWLLLLS